MSMWEAIQFVATPAALIAFVVAVVAQIYHWSVTRTKKLIEAAPEKKRAELITAALETYSIKQDNLTREQKFHLMTKVIEERAKRFRTVAIVSVVMALILSVVIILISIAPPLEGPIAEPSVHIISVEDEYGRPIDENSTPFKVYVKGIVSNAAGLRLCLVVDDGYAEYIQPGSVQIMGKDFAGYCYLGIENDPKSLNKRYSIFAVATDKEYEASEHLDRKTVKAISNVIDLLRTR